MSELENVAAGTSGASTVSHSDSSVTHGTADAAMVRAAMAASSTASDSGGSPETQPPTASPSTAGTTAPATSGPAETGAQPATGERGPIPYERHEAILRNARAEYAWAKGLNPQEAQNALRFARAAQANPAAFRAWLDKRGGNQQATGAQGKSSFQLPKPLLSSEDGRGAYAAEQMGEILSSHEQAIMSRLQPIIDHVVGQQTERHEAQTRESTRKLAKSALDRAMASPQFSENKDAIRDMLSSEEFAPIREEYGLIPAMLFAYMEVLKTKVFPSYQTAAAEQVRLDNLRKANSSRGSQQPSGSSGAPAKVELRNVTDLEKHMENLHRQANATA